MSEGHAWQPWYMMLVHANNRYRTSLWAVLAEGERHVVKQGWLDAETGADCG